MIGSLTVSSADDELVVTFYENGEFVADAVNSFNNNLNGPVLHLSYPVPVEADVIVVECDNESEDCEVALTVVGRQVADGS